MNPVFMAFQRWVKGLRFPYLLALMAALFVVDLFVPDLVPAIDEILLGLATALFASWRTRKSEGSAPGDSEPPRP